MKLSDLQATLSVGMSADMIGADVSYQGFSTDTRTVQSGNVFVALRGEIFDGHRFLSDAFDKGVAAVVVDKAFLSQDDSQALLAGRSALVVEDTLLAYGLLAADHAAGLKVKTAAITGSCGKTSVKEILSSLLTEQGCVLATKGNFNNEVGVPHTLLDFDSSHNFAVVEMGANHPGEIAYLSKLVGADVVTVLNADRAHLEGFGSVEGVVKAKGEIFSGAKSSGCAVLSLDEKHYAYWRDLALKKGLKLITTSIEDPAADVCLKARKQDAQGYSFTLSVLGQETEVSLPLLGEHNIKNALIAIGMATALGLRFEHIAGGLAKTQPAKGRLNVLPFYSTKATLKHIVIDDTL